MQHKLSDPSGDQPIGAATDHHDEIRFHRSRGLYDRWASGSVPDRSYDQVNALVLKLRGYTPEILGRLIDRRLLRSREADARQTRRVDGAYEDKLRAVVLLDELYRLRQCRFGPWRPIERNKNLHDLHWISFTTV